MQTTLEPALKPTLIEKEIINTLSFNAKNDINQHPDIINQISKATKLGNNHRRKVSIFFKDDVGIKRVDTTIWAFGAKCICLKGGLWIPSFNNSKLLGIQGYL